MNNSLAISLPPLRRKILRSFLSIVALYAVIGTFMMAAVFFASGITPRALHVNYDSIAAAIEMRKSIDALRHPGEWGKVAPEVWVGRFEKALSFEESNVTEPGEGDLARSLREGWSAIQARGIRELPTAGSLPIYEKMNRDLDGLIAVNQHGMFRFAEESTSIRNRVFAGAIAVFLFSMLVAVYMGDTLANRLSRPLKEIAEALRNKPVPGEKLRLPTPTSLEVRILTHEMGQLWKRLSELRKLNIEEIASQRSKLEAVFEKAVEDGFW